MTKQFLLYLNVRAVLVQKSRIRVPKGVPAEASAPSFHRNHRKSDAGDRVKSSKFRRYAYTRAR
jgi:hypothetical protein